jgi:hypothetical protein
MTIDRAGHQFTPNFNYLRLAVFGYSALIFVATIVAQAFLVNAVAVVLPSLTICAVCAVIGVLLLSIEIGEALKSPAGPGAPPPGPGPFPIIPAIVIVVLVIAVIGWAFWYSHNHQSAAFALAAGVASALAWGLSVVGALIWTSLGVLSSVRWNSWLNLFAAAFAALAVGSMPG